MSEQLNAVLDSLCKICGAPKGDPEYLFLCRSCEIGKCPNSPDHERNTPMAAPPIEKYGVFCWSGVGRQKTLTCPHHNVVSEAAAAKAVA
jgi:hypothetical protein